MSKKPRKHDTVNNRKTSPTYHLSRGSPNGRNQWHGLLVYSHEYGQEPYTETQAAQLLAEAQLLRRLADEARARAEKVETPTAFRMVRYTAGALNDIQRKTPMKVERKPNE